LNPILQVRHVKKYFPVKSGFFGRQRQFVHAVDGVTFDVDEGKTFGLVGESGCGKTTTGRVVLRLVEATAGQVTFMGRSVFELDRDELRQLRSQMQIVFQDPFASLNPRRRVRQILSDPFRIHSRFAEKEIEEEVMTLLDLVGLTPASLYVDRYPHEFSGGQRQRIAIARALAVKPKLVVADEPVSSLDISVRAQILNLMKKLQRELKLTYLFITHDLAVVRSLCNRVAVMYLGEIVELANTGDIFQDPRHPYTEALLSAMPIPDPETARHRIQIILVGDVPSPITLPSGCRFNTRCPMKSGVCMSRKPEMKQVGPSHFVSCHLRT